MEVVIVLATFAEGSSGAEHEVRTNPSALEASV